MDLPEVAELVRDADWWKLVGYDWSDPDYPGRALFPEVTEGNALEIVRCELEVQSEDWAGVAALGVEVVMACAVRFLAGYLEGVNDGQDL